MGWPNFLKRFVARMSPWLLPSCSYGTGGEPSGTQI